MSQKRQHDHIAAAAAAGSGVNILDDQRTTNKGGRHPHQKSPLTVAERGAGVSRQDLTNGNVRAAEKENILDLYQYYRFLNTNTHRDRFDHFLEVLDKESHTADNRRTLEDRAHLLKSRSDRDTAVQRRKVEKNAASSYEDLLYYGDDAQGIAARNKHPFYTTNHYGGSGDGSTAAWGRRRRQRLQHNRPNFDDGLSTDLQRAAIKEAFINAEEEEQAADSRYASPSMIAGGAKKQKKSSSSSSSSSGVFSSTKNALSGVWDWATHETDVSLKEDGAGIYVPTAASTPPGAAAAQDGNAQDAPMMQFKPTRDLFASKDLYAPSMATAEKRRRNYFNPRHLVANLMKYSSSRQHQQQRLREGNENKAGGEGEGEDDGDDSDNLPPPLPDLEKLPPNQRSIHALSRYATNPLTGEKLPYTELEDNIYSREWNQDFQLFPSREEEQLNERAARRVLGIHNNPHSPAGGTGTGKHSFDSINSRDAAKVYTHKLYGHPHYANDGTRLPNVFWELPFNYDIDYKHWPVEGYLGRVYTAHVAWRRNPWSDVFIMTVVGLLSVILAKVFVSTNTKNKQTRTLKKEKTKRRTSDSS